jgi:membrane-bound serine protease (ClpP class)
MSGEMWADPNVAFVLLVLAVLLLGIELKFYTHMISGLAGTVLLAFAATLLLRGREGMTPGLVWGVSAACGVITIFLGMLGMRARKRKLAVGMETLVGETGETRTAMDPEGTVFVHGEYWKARSAERLAAGERVRVEKVDNLMLVVKKSA